jgi:hypothetical protein
MRASVLALLGFGVLAVTCGDCDVRVISGAQAQARHASAWEAIVVAGRQAAPK